MEQVASADHGEYRIDESSSEQLRTGVNKCIWLPELDVGKDLAAAGRGVYLQNISPSESTSEDPAPQVVSERRKPGRFETKQLLYWKHHAISHFAGQILLWERKRHNSELRIGPGRSM